MKKKNLYIGLAIVIIVGGAYYWYRQAQTGSTATQYVTASAKKGTLTISVTGSGNVVVNQSASVDPTITGTVQGLAVNVGDTVKKGQLLFTIDNDQLGVSASQSYAQVQSVQQQLLQTKSDLHTFEKNGTGTHQDHMALEKKLEVAKLNVETSTASYRNQLKIAGERRVLAPISGTVNAINIKNGDDLSRLSSGNNASAAPIVIGDLSTLQAQVQVNEVDIASLSLGQKATLTFDALNGLSLIGQVEKLDALGTLSQGVVTYNVTIGFDSLDSHLRPGMSVTAAIVTAVRQDVVTVPSNAVKTQNGTTYVETLVGQTPRRHTVEVGISNGTDTEIISGINADDTVITQTILSSASTPASSSQNSGLRLPGLGGGGAGRALGR